MLNAISMVAVVIEEKFATYYSTFMPGLKSLLASLEMKDEKQLSIRVLVIECIGFLVSAVSKGEASPFQHDLDDIMKIMI